MPGLTPTMAHLRRHASDLLTNAGNSRLGARQVTTPHLAYKCDESRDLGSSAPRSARPTSEVLSVCELGVRELRIWEAPFGPCNSLP